MEQRSEQHLQQRARRVRMIVTVTAVQADEELRASEKPELAMKAWNRVWRQACEGSDTFRQWYYPNLPASYEVNRKVLGIILRCIQDGHDEEGTVLTVHAVYREDERERLAEGGARCCKSRQLQRSQQRGGSGARMAVQRSFGKRRGGRHALPALCTLRTRGNPEAVVHRNAPPGAEAAYIPVVAVAAVGRRRRGERLRGGARPRGAAMKAEQARAVEFLEKALEMCAERGVALFGMDNGLFAYSRAKLVTAGYFDQPDKDVLSVLRAVEHLDVNDHGAYVDSGGW
jgi:hypothetical protein